MSTKADRMTGSDSPQFTTRDLAVVAGITAFAALLRLYGLGQWSLWVDEAHTFRDATIDSEVFWENNVGRYPISALTLRTLMEQKLLGGSGEGWLRLPFAFFGILTIPAVALFGRSVIGRGPALLGALLLAAHPWHIYWSQNVRGYSITTFFATLGALLAHRAVRGRSVLLLLGSLFCVGIGGMAHPSGFLLIPAIFAFVLYEIWRDPGLRARILKPIVLGPLAVIAIGLAVWFVPAFLQAAVEKPDASIVHLVQTIVWYAGPVFVITTLGGLCALPRLGRPRESGFLVAWLMVPTIALLVIGLGFMKASARFGLFVAPAMCLLSAHLCFVVRDAVRKGPSGMAWQRIGLRWALPALLVANSLSYDVLYFTQQYGDRERWREAASIVQDRAGGRSLVITSHVPSMEYYLDRDAFYTKRPSSSIAHLVEGFSEWAFNECGNGGGGEQFLRNIADEAAEEGRVLFVIYSQPELDVHDQGTREGTFEGEPYRHESGEFEAALRRYGMQVDYLSNDIGPKDLSLQVWRVPLPLPERNSDQSSR